jgi:hypothetical protein
MPPRRETAGQPGEERRCHLRSAACPLVLLTLLLASTSTSMARPVNEPLKRCAALMRDLSRKTTVMQGFRTVTIERPAATCKLVVTE